MRCQGRPTEVTGKEDDKYKEEAEPRKGLFFSRRIE